MYQTRLRASLQSSALFASHLQLNLDLFSTNLKKFSCYGNSFINSSFTSSGSTSVPEAESRQLLPQTKLSFSKLLVANRGEIACRVIRTAKKLGLETVAVFSETDREALHVRAADSSVKLSEGDGKSSYLSIDAVLAACRATGAEAVHPGYGFLSENADFAKALHDAGIRFVGPPAGAIAAMGDKVESKRLARAAGVSTIPGHAGVIAGAEEAVAHARRIGFPVMIKASAGGGGKGMRVARSEEEVRQNFAIASQEALSSFGDGRILIEAFVEEPRHIEIQVIADKHGNCLWLPERECSIQRRNQKVIEEAPSTFIDAETRKAMGEQAVALARAVNYCSAGTVEFLVDKHRRFYFLEMNTRLQVEHPITEEITKLDLVEEMLRVADGQELSFDQERASSIHGWAMECRVYAEDPGRGFLPSTGRLDQYMEPRGIGVRCDAGVTQGNIISMFYDPMIAKLVTHGSTRAEALARMRAALDSYVIRGPEHNVPFLRSVLSMNDYAAGNITTGFIPLHFPHEGDTSPEKLPMTDHETHQMVAIAAALFADGGIRAGNADLLKEKMQVTVDLDGAPIEVSLEPAPRGTVPDSPDARLSLSVDVGSAMHALVELLSPAEDRYCPDLVPARVNGAPAVLQVIKRWPRGGVFQLNGAQRKLILQRTTVAELMQYMPPAAARDASKQIVAPMPGLIVEANATEGQTVIPGEAIVVLEAMKMQNVLRADTGGKVKSVHVRKGDVVSTDDVLVIFE